MRTVLVSARWIIVGVVVGELLKAAFKYGWVQGPLFFETLRGEKWVVLLS